MFRKKTDEWLSKRFVKAAFDLGAAVLSDNIRRKVDSEKLCSAIYLDLSEVFGHGVLLNKLSLDNWLLGNV